MKTRSSASLLPALLLAAIAAALSGPAAIASAASGKRTSRVRWMASKASAAGLPAFHGATPPRSLMA